MSKRKAMSPEELKAFGEVGVTLVDQSLMQKSRNKLVCEWRPTTEGNDHGDWSTDCGYEYTINDGTPSEKNRTI